MELINKIDRVLKRNNKKSIELTCYINEQGIPDIHIKEKPEEAYTEILDDEGIVLNVNFPRASFTFTEKHYGFHVDEFQNYISLGSKHYKDHYVILEFQ